MSQRREIIEDGKELLFDHGAPYFTATNADVLGLVRDWEARGLVAEWKENFGSFDFASQKFVDIEKNCTNVVEYGYFNMYICDLCFVKLQFL